MQAEICLIAEDDPVKESVIILNYLKAPFTELESPVLVFWLQFLENFQFVWLETRLMKTTADS